MIIYGPDVVIHETDMIIHGSYMIIHGPYMIAYVPGFRFLKINTRVAHLRTYAVYMENALSMIKPLLWQGTNDGGADVSFFFFVGIICRCYVLTKPISRTHKSKCRERISSQEDSKQVLVPSHPPIIVILVPPNSSLSAPLFFSLLGALAAPTNTRFPTGLRPPDARPQLHRTCARIFIYIYMYIYIYIHNI